jgi:large subunit ribosomal protein L10
MPNQKNKDTVQQLKNKLADAKSVIIADYQGLNANEINDLRSKLSEHGTEVSVQRNTLLKIALKEQNNLPEELEKELVGQVATFIAHKDAISPLKVIFAVSLQLRLK